MKEKDLKTSKKLVFQFPSHIYKEKIGSKNFILKELIFAINQEVVIENISKGPIKAFLLKPLNGEDEILLLKSNSNISLVEKYKKVIYLESGDFTMEGFENGTNIYKWLKHTKISARLDIDKNYLNLIRMTREGNFKIQEENEKIGELGLRRPQIGALYAIFSNYTVTNKTSTIVMPTGTGKTETMLGVLLKLKCDRLLVIVPTDALRDQISDKFLKLGIFRKIKLVTDICDSPIVGVLKKKLSSIDEIDEFFSKTNVVVSTINIIGGLSDEKQKYISGLCSHLFIDEAHHTPAKTWAKLKNNFGNTNIIQFTATPFRNDKKPVEGKIIYNYPLKKAQEEGYFKEITFKPVLEFDESLSDEKIRDMAIEQLKIDITEGKNHILMARCENINKAEQIYNTLYKDFTEFKPILVHSGVPETEKRNRLNQLKNLESRVVVCVDMLGEGYDLANLKIAALHYAHRSLGVTLQFIGRFTRTSGKDIGKATFIANIADEKFQSTLKELYSENSNWNNIISKESSIIINKQIKFEEFISGFDNLDIEDFNVALQNIKVPFSGRFFKHRIGDGSITWSSETIEHCIDENFVRGNIKYSVNNTEKILIVIEKKEGITKFGHIKELNEVNYMIHIISYDDSNKLFYILSDEFLRMKSIIKSFGGEHEIISGDDSFKAFFGLELLQLFIVGLKEELPGNIKYRMHAGIDIKKALTSRDGINKTKSNIFGFGFEDGVSTSIGASRKGKIWSKLNGNLFERKEWCQKISKKLLNPSASGNNLVDWVLELNKINSIPKKYPISIEWAEEVYKNYDRTYLKKEGDDFSIGIENVSIELINENANGTIEFKILSDDFDMTIKLFIEKTGITYSKSSGDSLILVKGKTEHNILDFLNEFHPVIRFDDGSILAGNYLTKLNFNVVGYDVDNIFTRDWTGVDIKKESQGINPKLRSSIQHKVIQDLISSGEYDLVFNDDGNGEIADIIGIKIDGGEQSIILELYHCKYSKEKNPGGRIDDLYTVCGQAQRSVRWTNLENTLTQIRERGIKQPGRYEFGDQGIVNKLFKMSQFYKTETRIYIIQPGLSKASISEEQKKLLEVTENYLRSTFNIKMKVLAST